MQTETKVKHTPDDRTANEDAEEAAEKARCAARAKYRAFIAMLEKIERAAGIFLADENADAENAMRGGACAYDTEEFYRAALCSAEFAANDRAAEEGFDLHAAIAKAEGR